MRILQVCHIFSHGGGIETYVKHLLDNLPRFGVEVALIGFDFNYSQLNKYIYQQITNSKNRWIYLIDLWRKVPFLKLCPSDVIHAHRLDDMFPFVLFHGSNPKVCTLHGRTLDNIRMKHSWFTTKVFEAVEKITVKKLAKQNSMFIAVDNSTKLFYTKRYPQLGKRTMTIPVGIDTEKFRTLNREEMLEKHKLNSGDKIIIYVGRLEKEKNLDFLLRSFFNVKKALGHVKLLLVGDGREHENLKKLSDNLGLQDSVIFLGSVDYSIMPELLNCADVLALCSEYEGSPTVIKEAFACKVPVVSTDVGDVSNIINNDNIGRIAKRDENDFAKNLIDMLSLDKDSMIEEFVIRVRQFSIERILSAVTEVYRNVAKQKG